MVPPGPACVKRLCVRLGDRACIELDPADREVFIRSTAAGERLGGLAWGTRAAAQALASAFVVASALAGALGATNLGTALAFGQMAFAASLVYVLLRR
jgi:LAO/AO transport system kinase